MVMTLVCAAPLAALALVDLNPDDDEVTADGQTSSTVGVAASVGTAPATTQPTPTTAARRPSTETPATAVPTTPVPTTATTTPSTTPPSTTAAPTTAPPTITITVAQAATGEVLDLVNAERAAEPDCDPLVVDERLGVAAQVHSDDMAANEYFSHTSPDGTTPQDRAEAADFTDPVGENIARGYRSPEDVMAAWMDSEGHRDNILNCGYDVIGVGLNDNGWYWTQMFGRTS
jgi:uncharacterized protein YkwD